MHCEWRRVWLCRVRGVGIEGVAPPTLHVIYVCTINYVCMLFARIHYAAAAVTCIIPIIITGIAIARYTHNLL